MPGEHREIETERTERIPEPLPRAPEPVGFDIETTGVGPSDLVTVACAWSPSRQAHCFYGQNPSAVMSLLDSASYIYTYNGMEFDLPRFARHCGITMERWARKTVDPLYMMKHAMGLGACTKLNDLLQENGFEPKSGSGLQAIQFWNEGNREALLSYCMDDARLTYEMCACKEGIKWCKRWVVRLHQPRVIDFLPTAEPHGNLTRS